MKAKTQLAIGVTAAAVGGLVVFATIAGWRKRKLIARRLAQLKGKPPPPGTAQPRGLRVDAWLASLSESQKAKIQDILTFWQKMSLLTINENDPREIRAWVLGLTPVQLGKIRGVLTSEQNEFVNQLLAEGRE